MEDPRLQEDVKEGLRAPKWSKGNKAGKYPGAGPYTSHIFSLALNRLSQNPLKTSHFIHGITQR